MTTIAIANQKGGVGKTTTAVSLAASLARRARSVLLLDLDAQGNATTNLGLSRCAAANAAYTLFDTAGHNNVTAAQTCVRNLQILAADMDLAGLDLELAGASDRALRLRRRLLTLESSGFEFAVLDCPPSFGVLTLNALVAADYLLVPLQCEFLALEGLAHLKRTVDSVRAAYNPSLSILGILLTMYDRRQSISDLVAKDVRSVFGDVVFETAIPRNVRLTEAPSHGLPISEYDPRSPGALAYERLTDEVLRRLAWQPAHA